MKKLFNVVKKNNTTSKKLILIVTDISPRILGSVNALSPRILGSVNALNSNMAFMFLGIFSLTFSSEHSSVKSLLIKQSVFVRLCERARVILRSFEYLWHCF